ncbi:MAG: dTMP kinase [Ignavibacteriae bacterium HGW-Ignavibacteriae-2]|jgi:dTMP kinase|nr:MAG: dTMP kinase [Ignavibacteriae bacterium HGW-Ignavibacteriae-2]
MFITFEGLDFCGKSTQVKLLRQYLIDLGQKVELIREPGGTTISEKIRKILLDRENSKMTIEAELLLFSASRAQLVREIIIPLLKENYYVISDRFHDSSIAYQGFGRGIDVHKVKEIQEFAIDGAIPEITFFIDIPIEEVKSRREKFEPESWDRIEVSLDDFYERVRAGYISLSHNNKRFILLDGLKSIEQIHDEVVKAIERYNRL